MTTPDVVLAVIRYLGRIALVLAGGALALTAYVLNLAGRAGSVDPVAVAAVAAITTLLGTVIGALGAILVSTRSGPSADSPPIPVTGPAGGPVETIDAGPEDPSGSDALEAVETPSGSSTTSRRRDRTTS